MNAHIQFMQTVSRLIIAVSVLSIFINLARVF